MECDKISAIITVSIILITAITIVSVKEGLWKTLKAFFGGILCGGIGAMVVFGFFLLVKFILGLFVDC